MLLYVSCLVCYYSLKESIYSRFKMWHAALLRFIRRRLVLGIIFASSLTYCIVSFLKEVSLLSTFSFETLLLRQDFKLNIFIYFRVTIKIWCIKMFLQNINHLCGEHFKSTTKLKILCVETQFKESLYLWMTEVICNSLHIKL